MDSLHRLSQSHLSQNRPGLSTHRLDGRLDLQHDSPAHKDLLERASVVRVSENDRAEAQAATEDQANPVARFFGACARKLSAWAHKIFG